MVGSLIVETLDDKYVLEPNADIYVHIGNGNFIKKKARDLNPGDLVPRSASVKIPLKKLEPYLLENLRYRNARDHLFFLNSEGKPVTKLRVLLLRGLTGNSPDLESRIMLETDDFNNEDYRKFIEQVYNTGPSVKKESLRPWLNSTYVAPENWKDFERLALINPEFMKMFESYSQENGFHAAYRLYVAIRTHVTRLNEGKVKGKIAEQVTEKPYAKKGNEIKDITEYVVGRYYAQIGDDIPATVITKIREANQDASIEEKVKTEGIIVGKPDVRDFKEIDITKLLNTEAILREAWGNALYEYFAKINNIEYSKPKREVLPLFELASYFVLEVTRFLVETSPVERMMIYGQHPIVRKVMEAEGKEAIVNKRTLLTNSIKQFMEDYKNGKADELLELRLYSLSDMADTLSQVRSALPSSFHRYMKLNSDIVRLAAILNPEAIVQKAHFFSAYIAPDDKLNRTDRRQIGRELKKLEEKASKLWSYLKEEYKIAGRKKFGYEIVGFETRNRDLLRQLMATATFKGESFFTKADIARTLGRYGLEDFVKYIKEENIL